MDLLSVFKRKAPLPAAPEPAAADAVQLARTRARHRLIGAAVLVVAGIIGFPLLFETQPRPIPVDLPIEIARKENLPMLPMPGAGAEAPARPASVPAPLPAPMPAAAPAKPAPPAPRVINETPAEAGREVAPAAPLASSPASPAPASAAAVEKATPAKPVAPPAVKASAPPAAAVVAVDGARAQALLEGKPGAATEAPAAAASAARFVVQVGAFAEPAALKEARAKVEKLGLKTYTQVAETPTGPRTRVRVGPFETRDEAERAAAKLKAAAMPAAILAL